MNRFALGKTVGFKIPEKFTKTFCVAAFVTLTGCNTVPLFDPVVEVSTKETAKGVLLTAKIGEALFERTEVRKQFEGFVTNDSMTFSFGINRIILNETRFQRVRREGLDAAYTTNWLTRRVQGLVQQRTPLYLVDFDADGAYDTFTYYHADGSISGEISPPITIRWYETTVNESAPTKELIYLGSSDGGLLVEYKEFRGTNAVEPVFSQTAQLELDNEGQVNFNDLVLRIESTHTGSLVYEVVSGSL